MKYLLTFLTLLLFTGFGTANTFYVSVSGTTEASGTSWSDALDLETATQRAVSGDQIWVATGTYLPTTSSNRNASFRIAAGVALFGGFAGNETSPAQRSATSRSVLSGDIGQTGNAADNVYTVLTLKADTDAGTLVDGFTIKEGVARSFTQGFDANNAGGGLFIEAAAEFLPAHLIVNCEFTDNKAHNGAGVFVAAGNSSFEQCVFENNIADFKGGAVYNRGTTTEANVRFLDCQFIHNGARYGGGMANNGENGICNPLLLRCDFIRNVAKSNAAAVYNMTNDAGECTIIAEACSFDNNVSKLGDDVATKGDKKSIAQLRENANAAGVIISGAAKK